MRADIATMELSRKRNNEPRTFVLREGTTSGGGRWWLVKTDEEQYKWAPHSFVSTSLEAELGVLSSLRLSDFGLPALHVADTEPTLPQLFVLPRKNLGNGYRHTHLNGSINLESKQEASQRKAKRIEGGGFTRGRKVRHDCCVPSSSADLLDAELVSPPTMDQTSWLEGSSSLRDAQVKWLARYQLVGIDLGPEVIGPSSTQAGKRAKRPTGDAKKIYDRAYNKLREAYRNLRVRVATGRCHRSGTQPLYPPPPILDGSPTHDAAAANFDLKVKWATELGAADAYTGASTESALAAVTFQLKVAWGDWYLASTSGDSSVPSPGQLYLKRKRGKANGSSPAVTSSPSKRAQSTKRAQSKSTKRARSTGSHPVTRPRSSPQRPSQTVMHPAVDQEAVVDQEASLPSPNCSPVAKTRVGRTISIKHGRYRGDSGDSGSSANELYSGSDSDYEPGDSSEGDEQANVHARNESEQTVARPASSHASPPRPSQASPSEAVGSTPSFQVPAPKRRRPEACTDLSAADVSCSTGDDDAPLTHREYRIEEALRNGEIDQVHSSTSSQMSPYCPTRCLLPLTGCRGRGRSCGHRLLRR